MNEGMNTRISLDNGAPNQTNGQKLSQIPEASLIIKAGGNKTPPNSHYCITCL